MLENEAVESLAHALVTGGIGVEPVWEVIDILGAEEVGSLDEVQVQVSCSTPRGDDLGFELADAAKGQRSDGQFDGAFDDRALTVVKGCWSRVILNDWAGDGGDEDEGRIGVAITDSVQESVDGRDECALAHRVAIDNVDPELEADQVGGVLGDHARGKRVEVALPGEREALQVDPGEPGGDRWPRPGRTGRPTLLATVGDVAHPRWRASAVGVYRLWRDAGFAIGALLAGVIADAFGLDAAIWTVAALTAASGLVT